MVALPVEPVVDYDEELAYVLAAMVADLDAEHEWRRDALCREYAHLVSFFPERGDRATAAKAICARCAVRQECRGFAESEHDVSRLAGVWGGRTRLDRRRDRGY